jgi:hypothetical protein
VAWVKPKKEDVASALVYSGAYGFRYSLRDAEGKVIYEAPHAFRSRYHAIEQIKKSYGLPINKISTEVG